MNQLLETVKTLSVDEVKILRNALNDHEFTLGIGKYCSGKIYKITYLLTNEIGYVGSTIKELPYRWSGHKSFIKSTPEASWSQYVNERGVENFKIELIENYPCKTLKELVAKEAEWVQTLNPVCNILLRGLSETEQRHERNLKRQLRDHDEEDDDICYSTISDLSENDFQQLQNIKWSSREMAQVEKYWFDKIITDSELNLQHRNNVFDTIISDRGKCNVFLNKFFEMSSNPDLTILNTLQFARYKAFSDMQSIVEKTKELCALLGLKNTHDDTVVMADDLIESNQVDIHQILLQLITSLKIRVKHNKLNGVSSVRRLLGNFLWTFSRVSLQNELTRTETILKADGKKYRKQYYTSKIIIEDDFIKQTLSLL